MRELHWDPLDFMTVLEVEAEDFDEDYGAIVYRAQRDSLELNVIVSPYHRSLQFAMEKEGATLFKVTVWVFGEIRRVFDLRGEFLEVNDCILAPNWFEYFENESQKSIKNRDVVVLRVFLKPHIQIIFD